MGGSASGALQSAGGRTTANRCARIRGQEPLVRVLLVRVLVVRVLLVHEAWKPASKGGGVLKLAVVPATGGLL